MKKILYSILASVGLFATVSCSDMLDVDSSAFVSDPDLNQKTDSVFYAFGIAQAMQQLADQYYFIGEMRGDLVKTTSCTDNNLRSLHNFTATSSNKYDSTYVYYKIINNCNYYLAHRDTTLMTGSTNVTTEEYAAIAAWRAWAYLQLGRTYEKVPFFTEPLTTVSQIEGNNFPELTLSQIIEQLAPSLEAYSGTKVPKYGLGETTYINIGNTNWGSQKIFSPQHIFVPVDVVLGEMYLENGEYMRAAQHYSTYLINEGKYSDSYMSINSKDWRSLPDAWDSDYNSASNTWNRIFSDNSVNDIITYIPMSVSSVRGTTTNIPLAYGYDYYAVDKSNNCPRTDDIQIAPSKEYYNLIDSTDYYFFTGEAVNGVYPVSKAKLGDGRGNSGKNYTNSSSNSYILNVDADDTTKVWIAKNATANVIVYRYTTVWLHLAEALNRAGYPDIAFAILRNGISDYLEQLIATPDASGNIQNYQYLSPASYNLLCNEVPFLSDANKAKYSSTDYSIFGIHMHGCSSVLPGSEASALLGSRRSAIGHTGDTLYLPKPVIGEKLKSIAKTYNVTVGTSLADSINAMEDLLCDEYAKEFAFEGTRFYDLVRLAHHKNNAGLYGGNFGDLWLSDKLKNNAAGITTKNCYLPFK